MQQALKLKRLVGHSLQNELPVLVGVV